MVNHDGRRWPRWRARSLVVDGNDYLVGRCRLHVTGRPAWYYRSLANGNTHFRIGPAHARRLAAVVVVVTNDEQQHRLPDGVDAELPEDVSSAVAELHGL